MVLVLMNINVQYYEGVTKRGVLDLTRHVKKRVTVSHVKIGIIKM